MRKVTFVTGAACVVAAALFFFAPAFRQAFRISLEAWYPVFHVASWHREPTAETLAKRAEARHDPEGLAFCAVRLQNSRESARLAEEAVRLDPNLLWVYAVVAVRHPMLAEIGEWQPRFEAWDPQNALFHLIAAESIDIDIYSKTANPKPGEMPKKLQGDPAWQHAMAAAFGSSKFDDYLGRLRELDRKVVLRYGFNDPVEVLDGEDQIGAPSHAFWDSELFAKSLLEPGKNLEVRGDRKGALEKYWAVAHFGQVIDSQAHTDYEHSLGLSLQAGAYKNLQAVFEMEANHGEAALFTYLAGKSKQPGCIGGT